MKKVMHVITGLDVGGAEMMLCRLLECSVDAEHRVLSLMEGGALKSRMLASGCMVDEMGLQRGGPSLRAGLGISRAVRSARPDLLQGWMYHGNIAATLAHLSSFRRAQLVWGIRHSLHDLAQEKPLTHWLIALGARLSRFAARIVYCSQASARQHEAIGYDAERTVVIPNGFDCEVFRPRPGSRARLCEELGVDPRRVLIGMVARYHPVKNHSDLFHAAAQLGESASFQLILLGRDINRQNEELDKLIRGARLSDRVSLLGERHDVPEIMAGLDLLVLPSLSEAFSQVLGEAMATGVPCVVTDVGDSRMIVGDTGIVVPPNDACGLATALNGMIEIGQESRMRLGQSARARVMDRWSIREVVRRYEAMYEEIGCNAALRYS